MYENQYVNTIPESNNVQEYPPLPQYYDPALQAYRPLYPNAGAPAMMMPQPVQGNGKAVAGLVLGIIALIAWLLPLVGFPIAITGLVLASKARKALVSQGMANAGYVLCIIALALTTINSFLGVIIAMQH